MAETTTGPTDGSSTEKPTKGRFLAILAVIGAGIAGFAAFVENMDKLGTEAHKLCQYVKLCAADPLPTPSFPSYDTGWMGGGHDPAEQCEPLANKYRAENPNFNIIRNSSEEHKKSTLGKVEYKYHCFYSAVPN